MNAQKIIRAAIPDANEDVISYIIWERTPYPIGNVSAKSLYKAASRLKRANDHNIRLCDLCDNMLQLDDELACKRCTRLLTNQTQGSKQIS